MDPTRSPSSPMPVPLPVGIRESDPLATHRLGMCTTKISLPDYEGTLPEDFAAALKTRSRAIRRDTKRMQPPDPPYLTTVPRPPCAAKE